MTSPTFYFGAGDTLDIITLVLSDTDPATGLSRITDLTNATSAVLYAGRAPNLTSLFNAKSMTFVSPRSSGKVQYQPLPGDIPSTITGSGVYDCCVVVTWADGNQTTFPNDGAFNNTFPQIKVSRLA